MKRLIFASFLALSLGGCSAPFPNGQSVAQSSPAISAKTEQALTVAHIAYNGISQEILLVTRSGVLRGQAAAQVKVYYDKAGDALLVADRADRAANESGVLSAISTANEALTMAKKLVGG